jgi:hypothetical protein
MKVAAAEVLAAVDALSPAEQREVAAEILRRASTDGDLSEQALDELADELFRGYDAEEAAAGGQ